MNAPPDERWDARAPALIAASLRVMLTLWGLCCVASGLFARGWLSGLIAGGVLAVGLFAVALRASHLAGARRCFGASNGVAFCHAGHIMDRCGHRDCRMQSTSVGLDPQCLAPATFLARHLCLVSYSTAKGRGA